MTSSRCRPWLRNTLRCALTGGCVVVAVLACVSPTSDALSHLVQRFPDPELNPLDVVQIQIDAFRNNDAADRGIEIAFRFASPANRNVTGPLDRFSGMVKTGSYAAMLAAEDVQYGSVIERGSLAQVPVTVFTADGYSTTYLFFLRKQMHDEYARCWMTESVQVMPPKPPNTSVV